jgi:hypothetical protein
VQTLATPGRFGLFTCRFLVTNLILYIHFLELHLWIRVSVALLNLLHSYSCVELVLDEFAIRLQNLLFFIKWHFSIFQSLQDFFPPKIVNYHLNRHFGFVVASHLGKVAETVADGWL